MRTIRIKDLEVIEQEKQSAKLAEQSTIKTLAELTVEVKKKDTLIKQLTQTVANLNLEIAKLKGGQ